MSWNYKRLTVDGEVRLKHRYKMEQELGRELENDEVVHHKNRDPADNRLENLEVMKQSEHSKLHSEERGRTVELKCANCGKEFERAWHQRPEVKGYDNAYCSQECSGEINSSNIGGAQNINTEVDNEVIRQELKKGETGYSIAKKYNWPNGTVYNRIRSMEDV